MDGRLYLAPLSNSHYVLDIGTGTGIWAIEFGDSLLKSYLLLRTSILNVRSRRTSLSRRNWYRLEPNPARIVRDLLIVSSVALTEILSLPPNCSFEVADAEDEWLFNQKFDFIHGRALLSCFRDNRSVVDTIFNNLNPGGYFELQDVCMPMRSDDGTLDGTALDEWQTNIIAGLKTTGRNLSDSTNWGKYMADAGFVDIVEQRYYWGTNPWVRGKKEKIQAAWTTQNLLEGIDGMSMALFTRILGWTRPRVEILLAQVRNDLKNRAIHAYAEVYVVHGRKPNEDQ
jgi:ubiquinone/menaquinone biosynthesis C-methylase UbiE